MKRRSRYTKEERAALAEEKAVREAQARADALKTRKLFAIHALAETIFARQASTWGQTVTHEEATKFVFSALRSAEAFVNIVGVE